LQPAQLDALQEEQPEDIEWLVPSLERETPLKQEKTRSTSPEAQSGHAIALSDEDPMMSFSNSDLHFKHLYSNIGMISSAPYPVSIAQQAVVSW